eukprot:699779-Pleurochrysis_carterae.AAC.1
MKTRNNTSALGISTLGQRFSIEGEPPRLFVWHVHHEKHVVAVKYDDPIVAWKEISLKEFQTHATREERDSKLDFDTWRNSADFVPMDLPVANVVFALVSGRHKKKCQCGTLRASYAAISASVDDDSHATPYMPGLRKLDSE